MMSDLFMPVSRSASGSRRTGSIIHIKLAAAGRQSHARFLYVRGRKTGGRANRRLIRHADHQSVRLTTSCARNAACSASGAPTAPRRSSRSASTRSSIAARKRRASPAGTAAPSTRHRGDGPCRRQFRQGRGDPPPRRRRRDRPCPLLDHRRDRACATSSRLFAELASGGFAVAHNGNISNAMRLRARAQPARLDLPVDQRHRGHHPPRRHLELPHPARPVHRRAEAGRGRLFAGLPDRRGHDRLPRPARHPAAGHGPARRCLHLRLGDGRARRGRRDLYPLGRAGRADRSSRTRASARSARSRRTGRGPASSSISISRGPTSILDGALGLFGAQGDRRRAGARESGRGRFRRAGPRFGRAGGDRLCPGRAASRSSSASSARIMSAAPSSSRATRSAISASS